LVEGGLSTEATVPYVLVGRYADHLPLYRQAQIMARQDVLLDRFTLAAWVAKRALRSRRWFGGCARSCWARRGSMPMVRGTASNGVPVLDPGRGRTKQGYFWAIARDDRPWGGTDPPGVVHRYVPGRGREHAKALLGGPSGILQCDGYAAYKSLIAPAADAGPALLATCWSYVRRGFYDLARSKAAPSAEEALQRIAALYAIEAEIRGKAPELRLAVRMRRSGPLVCDLFAWFEQQLARLPGRSPTAEVIRYALNQREGVLRFLEDGRVDLDTNPVERAIRPIAPSRKDALFAGSDGGGEIWATIASLIETGKLNAVDPQRYLADVLTRLISRWPQARIAELMPWCWAATNPG
jgi:transposase